MATVLDVFGMKRRHFISSISSLAAALPLAALGGTIPAIPKPSKARVVIVGGGFAGASAAKYLRQDSNGTVDVTLIEPNPDFISCPLSNLVLGGERQLDELTLSYENLVRHHGIRLIKDRVIHIDADRRRVMLADGNNLSYDRLIVSPGIGFMWEQLSGLQNPADQNKVLHGWQGNAQFLQLRRRIEAMTDGDSFVISIPQAPLRCPPAPYERACLVADYLKRSNKKGKVLILDGNDEVLSQARLFKQAWATRYADIIEYRPGFVTAEVDIDNNTVISDFGDQVRATVLNLIPPQRAGNIAVASGLANMNQRWCEVDFLSFESTQAANIHILGDAIQIAPLMPKSAQMASQQGHACARAILALLNDLPPDSHAMLDSMCYSFVSSGSAMHIQSTHQYDVAQKTFLRVSGTASDAVQESETVNAIQWAERLWQDCLG